jgi:hypothetical protein
VPDDLVRRVTGQGLAAAIPAGDRAVYIERDDLVVGDRTKDRPEVTQSVSRVLVTLALRDRLLACSPVDLTPAHPMPAVAASAKTSYLSLLFSMTRDGSLPAQTDRRDRNSAHAPLIQLTGIRRCGTTRLRTGAPAPSNFIAATSSLYRWWCSLCQVSVVVVPHVARRVCEPLSPGRSCRSSGTESGQTPASALQNRRPDAPAGGDR